MFRTFQLITTLNMTQTGIIPILTYYATYFAMLMVPIAQLAKNRLSDAGGPRLESRTGRVTGKFHFAR